MPLYLITGTAFWTQGFDYTFQSPDETTARARAKQSAEDDLNEHLLSLHEVVIQHVEVQEPLPAPPPPDPTVVCAQTALAELDNIVRLLHNAGESFEDRETQMGFRDLNEARRLLHTLINRDV